MSIAIYSAIFTAAALLGWIAYPFIERPSDKFMTARAGEAKTELADIFIELPLERLKVYLFLVPVALAVIAWVLTAQLPLVVAALVMGVVVPRIFVKQMRIKRLRRFEKMLVDSLLLLSSCLRAGLSMIQGFQIVVEEMSSPINEEFGLLLKEMKMGVAFEDAIRNFQRRNNIDETNLFVTAVLVARESGGDVTSIFTQLVSTMRERKKIKEKIKTLTFMSKAQGFLMLMLPVGFMGFTYTTNPAHAMFFFTDPMGRMVFVGVILLQAFGMFLFYLFSRSPM